MLTPEELEQRRRELDERRRQKHEERRKRTLFYLICAAVGVVLLVVAAYLSYSARFPGFGASSQRSNANVMTVLVLGVDAGLQGGARSDTMMLFSVDKQSGNIGALSIPRDTRVQIPGRRGFDRINAAHAIGGPDLAVRTVEQLLGVKIDYYVRLDFDGFESIVNTLGGVVIDVERPMYYVDRAQNLYIDLKPGIQLLNGEQALDYVRFRADRMGDVTLVGAGESAYAGRVDRQLKFVQALAKQSMTPRTLLVAPQLVVQLRQAVTSNMSTEEALRFVLQVKDVPSHNLRTAVLPGSGEMVGGASYWVVDTPKAREVVNRLIVHRQGMVRVEVLNGSGRDGIASQVANVLREKGFEVVAVGNADHFGYSETSIIPRRGNPVTADEVAKALGRDPDQAAQSHVSSPIVATDADVTVILGRDFHI